MLCVSNDELSSRLLGRKGKLHLHLHWRESNGPPDLSSCRRKGHGPLGHWRCCKAVLFSPEDDEDAYVCVAVVAGDWALGARACWRVGVACTQELCIRESIETKRVLHLRTLNTAPGVALTRRPKQGEDGGKQRAGDCTLSLAAFHLFSLSDIST
jgi:hypothetical protein